MVSVLLPTYNRAVYLPQCIESVLKQTFQDFEFIIIDDGSTDNTPQLVRSYKDRRIQYIQYPHCGNLSKMRNICIQKAQGDHLAFIDSDDLWLPNKLQRQVETLSQNPNVGFVVSDVVEFKKNTIVRTGIYSKSLVEELSAPMNLLPYILANSLAIYPTAVMFNRACISVTGKFNEKFNIADTEYVGRASCSFLALIIPEKLAKIRKHDENFSYQNRDDIFDELFGLIDLLLKKDEISEAEHRDLYCQYHYRSGMTKAYFSNYKGARSAFYQVLKKKPLSAKIWFRYIQSYLMIFLKTNYSKRYQK